MGFSISGGVIRSSMGATHSRHGLVLLVKLLFYFWLAVGYGAIERG